MSYMKKSTATRPTPQQESKICGVKDFSAKESIEKASGTHPRSISSSSESDDVLLTAFYRASLPAPKKRIVPFAKKSTATRPTPQQESKACGVKDFTAKASTEKASPTHPRSIPSSPESAELMVLPIADKDGIHEPAHKKRILQYVKKSTTPRAESSSTSAARQQENKIAELRGANESKMEVTSTSPRSLSSSYDSDELLSAFTANQGEIYKPAPKKRILQNAKKSVTSSSTPAARQQKSKISGLRGLSVDQLITLIDAIIEKHPEIKNEVVGLIPLPDLTQFENKLEALKKNIDKSFPRSKYGSGRNAFCYQRVKTHLDTFQVECIQQFRTLIDYEQWNTVIDYAIIAFKYVNQLPEWDESKHNKHKPECYKKITLHLVNAFKKGTFEKQKLKGFITRIKKLAEEGHNDSGIQDVIKLAETTLNKI